MKLYRVNYITDLGDEGANWFSNKRDAEKFNKLGGDSVGDEIQTYGVDLVEFKPTKKGIIRLLNLETSAYVF